MQKIETDKAPKAIGPYSQAVKAGGFLFISGQIGIEFQTGNLVPGGVKEQTIQVLANVESILAAAGLSLGNVVRVDVFLSSLKDYQEMNEVYGSKFTSEIKPTRLTVAVSALPKDALVEISCVAVIKPE